MSASNREKKARRQERNARKAAWTLTYEDRLRIEADLAKQGYLFAGNREARRGNPTRSWPKHAR